MGPKTIPRSRSSISDECYLYAKYNKSASTIEHVFFNFSGSFTDGKSVARCVAIITIFIINNGTFLGLNLRVCYINSLGEP